jgi:hypothetical protein
MDDWLAHAACRETDVNLFHDPPFVYALTVCSTCPVTTECLTYVRSYETPIRSTAAIRRYGVYGGTTPGERAGEPRTTAGRKVQYRRPLGFLCINGHDRWSLWRDNDMHCLDCGTRFTLRKRERAFGMAMLGRRDA